VITENGNYYDKVYLHAPKADGSQLNLSQGIPQKIEK